MALAALLLCMWFPIPTGCSEAGQDSLKPVSGDLGRRLADREVPPAAASAAWQILRDHHRSPFGTVVAFELEGSAYLARIERHYSAPGSEGRPQGFHKGVTLYEPAGR